jgi:hypothetical protein
MEDGNIQNFEAYLRFSGPGVDEGSIDVEQIGKSLTSLGKVFKQYKRKVAEIDSRVDFEIKVQGLQKGSTTVQIIVEQIMATPIDESASLYLFLRATGITEFGKQFFGTIANQLVLRWFAKGKRLKEEDPFLKENRVFIKLINIENEEKIVLLDDWNKYKLLYRDSKGLVQLGQDQKLTVGYKDGESKKDLVTMEYDGKQFYDSDLERSFEEIANDPFDEQNAIDCKLVGKFVDYHGLAYKYPFSFQVRRNQEEIGKHKILCMVESEDVSRIIEYLKPENSVNLCVFGKATKDYEGKIDKIKIERFSEDLDFNPDQISMIDSL